MSVRASPDKSVRRRREADALLLEMAAARPGGVVRVVRGEPGIGKTTLISDVAEGCGRRVLRTQGLPGEGALPFATIADLLGGVRSGFTTLPTVQREALEVSLSLRAGTPGSPLTVCTAALGALATAADRGPLLVAVDDFGWVDPASRQILLFLAHRLRHERIALLLAVRDEAPEDLSLDGLPVVDLAPLPDGDARALVRSVAPDCAADIVDDVVDLACGNPLALIEVARETSTSPVARPSTAFPSGGSALRRSWSSALGALPSRSRTALALLALSRLSSRADVEPVLTDLGLDLDDLAPAERRRLVLVTEHDVHLRHGLLGPVVLATTTLADRKRILDRLAARAPEEHAVWYAAQAATGPDDALADRLAVVAEAARARSALLEAATAWGRAAELTSDPERGAVRLLAAATDAGLGGRSGLARTQSEAGLRLASVPEVLADLELVRTRALMWSGRPRVAVEGALRASDVVLPHDAVRAVRLRAEAALPCALIGDVRWMTAIAGQARRLDPGPPSVAISALVGYAEALAGRTGPARAALDEARHALPAADPRRDGQALATYALALHFGEQPEEARVLADAVVETSRVGGLPLLLSYALLVRAELDTAAGRWAEARADAVEALGLARELDEVANHALASFQLARIEAARGRSADARRRVEHGLALSGSHGFESMFVYADAALGADALARGDAESAVVHLADARRRVDRHGMANLLVVPFAGDLVEAHVHLGDRDGARAALDWVETRADTHWARAVAASARGQLAEDPDEADKGFAGAYAELDVLDRPYERARTLLAHAATRRRWRRAALARPLLHDAVMRFAALGATPWVERARAELAATGYRGPVDHDPGDAADGLTPQEFQVARLVVGGRNNVETAAALFVSRKTVEAHLTRIYRKLGVRSRKELAAAIRDRPALRRVDAT